MKERLEGFLTIPNGLAISKHPTFYNMVFFIGSLMERFFCMNGIQQYCPDRTRGLCKRRLKITGLFLMKFLFLGLNFAKVTLFRCFSLSLTFWQIIYFEYLKNEYIHVYGN